MISMVIVTVGIAIINITMTRVVIMSIRISMSCVIMYRVMIRSVTLLSIMSLLTRNIASFIIGVSIGIVL